MIFIHNNKFICIFPLIPDAGENDVSSTCNDSESFIDLNTLQNPSSKNNRNFYNTKIEQAFYIM